MRGIKSDSRWNRNWDVLNNAAVLNRQDTLFKWNVTWDVFKLFSGTTSLEVYCVEP
jgi:hypothetical protein